MIFVLELSGGIAGYLLRDRVEDVLDQKLEATMKHFGNPDFNTTTEMWNDMQTSVSILVSREDQRM